MFFVLSKLLAFLLLPLTWIIATLLYAVFTKKQGRRKRLLIAGTVTLLFFSNPFMANILARCWDTAPYKATHANYSTVILLGGFVSEDNNGGGYFNWTADRYIQATKLLLNHKASHLLFTGGNASISPDGFTEASFVKTELKKLNIPDSVVLIESRSRNTIENAEYSKSLIKKAGLRPPYLLVTSAFHMRRAMLVFRKAGLNVVPYPCNYLNTGESAFINNLIPSTDAITTWNLYLKEIVGYLVTSIKST